jgi:hypothetical protein
MKEEDFILIVFFFSSLFAVFAYLFLDQQNLSIQEKVNTNPSIRAAIKDFVYTKKQSVPATPLLTQAVELIAPTNVTAPNPIDSLPKFIAIPFKISDKVFDISTDIAAGSIKTIFAPAFLSYRAIKALVR